MAKNNMEKNNMAKNQEKTKPSQEKTKSTAKAQPKGAKSVIRTSADSGSKNETNLIRRVTKKAIPTSIDHFNTGDTVNVYVKVKEGEKERVQLYKGVVIKVQGSGAAKSFTVRKMSSGVGVERTFPFASPALDRVETVTKGKVRRSRLYYLRALDGKAAKLESELVVRGETAGTESAAGESTTKEA